jgi:hypothetical protein
MNMKKSNKIILREYKDSQGNLHTEYKDSLGNIHNEYKDPQGNLHTNNVDDPDNAHSYKSGYTDGHFAQERRDEEKEVLEDDNKSKGLLIGVIVACVAGLTAGTIYFMTRDNTPPPLPVVVAPINQSSPTPTPTPPEPEVRIVEKPVVTIVPAPAPQNQPNESTVNITTNPPASNPSETAKPSPEAPNTPTTAPVATPPPAPAPTPTPAPIVAKTDNQLTSEILKHLQNNLSDNQLKVLVKDGAVTISGTVVNQEQLQQIQPLLRSIQGIKSLNITATVL